MINNFWRAIGTIQNEPVKQKMGDDSVCAKTVIAIHNKGRDDTIVPIVAYNKKAQILCALAHKGSIIHAIGTLMSQTDVKQNGRVLVGMTFKLLDFDVLSKEPVKDIDYIDVVELYDPDTFIKGGNHNVE